MTGTPIKILIIRFSSIGDIVLTSPVIRCIRKTHPEAQIHFLTKAKFSDIIIANPNIDVFHFLEDNLNETIDLVKGHNFDFVIDLHNNARTYLVKRRLRATSFSFRKLNWEKWLLVNFKINRLPRMHIVDRYFEAVSKIGVTNDGEGLDYFIPEGNELPANFFPEGFRSKFIAVVIGGTFFTKRFPAEKIIRVCEGLEAPVVLLGGAAEVDEATKIAAALGSKALNAVNQLSISQSALVIREAKAVLTNDTGLMHIAAAFQKPVVSVWGNTIPEFGMTPYFGMLEPAPAGSEIMEVTGLSCRPCSKLGYGSCPKKHFKCMNDLDETKIREALNKTIPW
jgi:ADP-heptose:LPS heptosyltransferase